MSEINIEIGEAMKNARKQYGMSRVEMARRLGVTDVAVFYWETGRNSISIDNLKAYCDILNINMLDLLASIPAYRK